MSNRLLIGPLGGGDVGLRVSRAGYDAADPDIANEQVSFDSRWAGAMRLRESGAAIYASAGVRTVSFATTFSVIPIVFVFYVSSGFYRPVFAEDVFPTPPIQVAEDYFRIYFPAGTTYLWLAFTP